MLVRRCIVALLTAAGLVSAPALVAAAAPGLPHESSQFGLDPTSQDALSNVAGLHAGGAGLGLADAAGARHVTANGDVLYTVGGGAAGEDMLVDRDGIGYATIAGDHGVHVVAPDGHTIDTYDLSWVDPLIQPTALTLDVGAPDWFPRTLYVQTASDGTIVLDLDAPTADVASSSGFAPTLPGGIVAVAPDHTLYITSGSSDQIWHYTDDGIRLASLTVPSDSGNAPAPVALKGLAIDATGTIYASDAANSRVVELSTSGTVLGQFGEADPFPSTASSQFVGALDGPGLLAIDCRGAIWLVDTDATGKSRVIEFTGVAAPTGTCPPAAPAPVVVGPTSQQAREVAVDRAGNRYLTSFGRVEKYDAGGHLVLSWGSDHPTQGSDAAFGLPSAVGADPVNGDVWVVGYKWATYDSNGNIFSIVSGEAKLQRFSPTGALRSKVTTPTGGATFVSPSAMAVRPSDGHVFVGDSTLLTVQELDRTGMLVRTFQVQPLAGAEPSTTPSVSAVGFDKLGELLVSARQRAGHVTSPNPYNWYVGGVEKFSAGGSYLTTSPVPQNFPTADPPSSMALLADGSMLWTSSPNLPPSPFATPRVLLAVNSALVATRTVLDGTLDTSSAPGLAVDCRGNVDLTDPGHSRLLVLRFSTKKCTWLPSATTGGGSARTRTSLTVKGSTNPSAQVTRIRVLYGATAKYGKATSWVTLPSDNVTITKSFMLTGLLHAHTYHYKVQVTNASGTVSGKDRTGTTR